MSLDLGLLLYVVQIATLGAVYALLCLGLNVHWGFTGLMNAGIAGFVAVGAYASAIATAPESASHLGGFGLPAPVGWLLAMLVSGFLAVPVGLITLRLRTDYLAIATIGIAEILRLVVRNEDWLTGGPLGISNLPRPFEGLGQPWAPVLFLALLAALILAVYWLAERAIRSPWGRAQRAIRENEAAAAAMGKDVRSFRLQSFVLGAAFMGLGGAMIAHASKFMSPDAVDPLVTTFLVWVMLIAGGSGNNRGAVLGAFLVWGIWAATDFLTAYLPPELATRAAYLRLFLIGLALQLILIHRPEGLIGEKPPKPADAV
ncbi:MAG TPA: branched-chain amino acid ABC transporter permease [Azospirillaceae bacterium]|nr:branched-chain amino acid ABC transporter permease [Azospirillaceae bacterium]